MNKVLADRRSGLFFAAPAIMVYALVMLVPLVWTSALSFFEGNAIKGFGWAGLSNWSAFLSDSDAHQALRITVGYGLVLTMTQVLLGYFLALFYVFVLRNQSGFVRTVVFLPVVLPSIAVGLLFRRLFAAGSSPGIVNQALEMIGLSQVDWLGSGSTAMVVILCMDLWRSVGFYALLLYSGIIDVPQELIEAARLDGAQGLRLVRTMILPLSMPILLSAAIFSVNGSLQSFDSIMAVTRGGPGNDTTPLSVQMFTESFSYAEFGYGSTIAVTLGLVCFAATVVVLLLSRKFGADHD